MKTIISVGDFIDIYQKLLQEGLGYLSKRFALSEESRIKRAWNKKSRPPIHWWSIPRVRERWNKKITGNTNINYSDYVVNNYLKNKKNLRMISPGCGSGTNETKFAKHNCFSRVEGFDLSREKINIANENAKKLQLSNLHYFEEDANSFDFGHERYDIILFHSSLHHFKNPKTILEKTHKAIKENGFLLINEYIGPNRFQWTDEQLKKANYYLNKVPPKYRRLWNSDHIKKKIYRPGLLRMFLSDPSEAINSEDILPQTRRIFTKLKEKPYGGNLLHLIFKDISHNFIDSTKEIKKILDFLFQAEDEFLKNNIQSDFIFGIYTKD